MNFNEKEIFFIKYEKAFYAAALLFYLILLFIANYATKEQSDGFEFFLHEYNFPEKIISFIKNKSLIYMDKKGAFIAILIFYFFHPAL
jgi:hypothetical protein